MSNLKYSQLQNKQWLEQKYKQEKLSTVKIAHVIGFSTSAVLYALKKHEIKTREMSDACSIAERKNKNKLLSDEEWLRKQYIENLLSTHEIAKLAGSSQKRVCLYLKKYGIPSRSISLAKKIRHKNRPIKSKYDKLNNREWLEEKYVQEKLSSHDIAKMLDCSPGLVVYYLHKYKINFRKYKWKRLDK